MNSDSVNLLLAFAAENGVAHEWTVTGGEVAWNENTPRGIVCVVRVAGFAGLESTRPATR